MRSLRTIIPILACSIFLSSCGLAAERSSIDASNLDTLTDSRLEDILATASFPIDRERCEHGLLEAIRKAENGEDVWDLNKHLRSQGCLDRHSRIEARTALPPLFIPSVYVAKRGDMHHVCIRSFDRDTADILRKKLSRMPSTATILLDLRGNGGGMLGSLDESTGVLGVAESFAPYAGAPIVTLFPKEGGARTFRARERGSFAGIRLAVLVNESTGSAAEILAGILQLWYDRVDLIGSRTYGKGVYQIPVGDDAIDILVTAGRFWIGSPEEYLEIDGTGILPTIEAESPKPLPGCFLLSFDEAAQSALQILEAN